MESPTFTLPWNLVTRNVHGHELLRKQIHQKINKLSRPLRRFPPGTVHLQVLLEKHPRRPEYLAGLTLRVPSNISRAEETGTDVTQALDKAVRPLLRELDSLKAELRREMVWKRKGRRSLRHEWKASGFAPAPQPEGGRLTESERCHPGVASGTLRAAAAFCPPAALARHHGRPRSRPGPSIPAQWWMKWHGGPCGSRARNLLA